MWQYSPRAQKDAPQVDPEHLVPERSWHIYNEGSRIDARIIDENIDGTKLN
jgi:hypothetical protein